LIWKNSAGFVKKQKVLIFLVRRVVVMLCAALVNNVMQNNINNGKIKTEINI